MPRLGQIWPGLAEKGVRIGVKCGLGGCHMGRQGLGCTWVDPNRCQDAFPGLVGPYIASGGQFGANFHIFGFFRRGCPLSPYYSRCGVRPIKAPIPPVRARSELGWLDVSPGTGCLPSAVTMHFLKN